MNYKSNEKLHAFWMTCNGLRERVLQAALYGAALLSFIACALSHQAVLAQNVTLPQGATVVNGQASINTNGAQMNVVNTPGAVINWNSFNIGSGAGVNFQQQSSSSSVMNRVTGGNISTIYGHLNSNGRVILVNPAGLVIGSGAVVDTAGFVGSALNATEANAQLDRLRFDSAGGAGRIQVDGMIRSQSGDIVLIAPDIGVGVSGLIQAPNGAVTLAAGQRVQLIGRGLDGIMLELQAPSNSAINLGRIEGEAVGLFASQLRHSGIIDARQASIEGGRIVLRAADQLTVTGTITADGITDAQGQRGRGGNISLEGTRIALQGATISASGSAGGGSVSVGGGWQGKDSAIRNASQTFVDQATRINVNALAAGNGGQVVVWSDGDTWFAGKIESKGGENSGNGGRVEVSGKQRLGYHGVVNTTAANGQAGSLLLDPKNIYIVASGTSTFSTTISFPSGGTDDFFIDAGVLSSTIGTVTLQASNDIFINAFFTVGFSGQAQHLVLEAGRSVMINSAVNFGGYSFTPAHSLLIIANSSALPADRDAGIGRIDMTGGSITMRDPDSVNLIVQAGAGAGTGGDIFLTNVTAGTIQAQAQTGITRSGGAEQLLARRVVLSTQAGNIGSSTNSILVSPFGSATSTTVDLSLYASGAGSAYIKDGANTATFRLAPSVFNPNYAALVSDTLEVINDKGNILIGALVSESGSADVAGDVIKMRAGSSSGNGQIQIAQANGQPLNLVANQTMDLQARDASSSDGIVIGGASSAGTIELQAGTSMVLRAQAPLITNSIRVQGGSDATHTTRISAGNTLSVVATGNIDIVGATVGNSTTSGLVTLNAGGNISIDAGVDQNADVLGRRVELIALSTATGQGDVGIRAYQGASAIVTSGVDGVQVSAGNSLNVNSFVADVNQTSAIEALGGGSVNINASSVRIEGGFNNNAKAVVATRGGGSINIISGDMTLRTGTGVGSGASIDSSGDVSITMASLARNILIDASGGKNSNTGIKAAGDVSIDTNGLSINATDGPTNNVLFGITATGIVSVTAGFKIAVESSNNASSGDSSAVIYGAAGVTLNMTNTDQAISLSGGAGAQSSARIESMGGQLNIISARGLDVTGGSGTDSFASITNQGAINVNAVAINLTSGAGNNAGATIKATGDINVDASVLNIKASGAKNSNTGIKTLGNAYIRTNDLDIGATNGSANNAIYGITANGLVTLEVTNTVKLSGNGDNPSLNTDAIISGGAGVQITTGSGITLEAGNGVATNARIVSSGNITLTGSVFLDAGIGTNTFALVTTTGSVSLSEAPLFVVGSGSASHALIYAGANSVTLALTYPTRPIATLEQVSASVASIVAIVVPQPDVSTTIALPSGLPVGTTGTGVITFTNLSPLTSTFTATAVINGVTQSFPVVVGANGSTSVSVVVTSTPAGGTVSANIGLVSAVLGSTTLAESNVVNNAANASLAPLFADISTTLVLPIGSIPGTFATGTYTFTNNGAATTTFTPNIVIDGVTSTGAPLILGPGGSTAVSLPVLVGTTGAVVSISAVGSSVPETGLGNNAASGSLQAFITDISTVITAPSAAPAGSIVPVTYTFTNNSAFTTTFTPLLVANGVTTTLAAVTLPPNGSVTNSQNVMIAGNAINVTINTVSSTLPDLNPANNIGTAGTAALLPNVITTISNPSSATVGTTVTAVVTYVNTGTVSSQFTSTVVIGGVTQNSVITLGAGLSQSLTFVVPVGNTAGATVSANAINLYDQNPSDNAASTLIAGIPPIVIPPPSTDVATLITAPASAPAGSIVPVTYTFTNNSAFTTTFTPFLLANGVTTTLGPITLPPNSSVTNSQNVMIAGTVINISINTGSTTLPDLNPIDNVSTAGTAALLPNVITTISSPASVTAGFTTTAIVTYVNTGSVSAQFTSTIVIGGVAQNSVFTLGVGQTQGLVLTVPVGTAGATVSADAMNLYDQNPSDNAATASIIGIPSVAPVVIPPVVIPPNSTPTFVAFLIAPAIQDNLLLQNIVLATLAPSGSQINTNNSGNTTDQRPDAREDVQAEGGAPICLR